MTQLLQDIEQKTKFKFCLNDKEGDEKYSKFEWPYYKAMFVNVFGF